MKKIGVLLAVLLMFSLVGFAAAENGDMPSLPGGDDKAAVEGAVSSIPIDEGTGEVDPEKVKQFKSKAEERIDAINLWMAENAAWLKVIFGMVPEISWLFAINFYILLFFIVSLILNGESLFVFLSKRNAKLLGAGIFVIGVVTKFFTNVLARPAHKFWEFVFEYVFSTWGLIVAIIIMVLIGIVFIVLLIYFPHVLIAIHSWIKKKREEKAKEKEEVNRAALGKIVEGATGS